MQGRGAVGRWERVGMGEWWGGLGFGGGFSIREKGLNRRRKSRRRSEILSLHSPCSLSIFPNSKTLRHSQQGPYADLNARRYHLPFQTPSPHQLQLIIRRPPRLRKTQAPLNTLQKLPRHLVAHNMRLALVALVQFFARRALVDTDHGYADGPCTESYFFLLDYASNAAEGGEREG